MRTALLLASSLWITACVGEDDKPGGAWSPGKADGAYDPTDSVAAFQYIHKHRAAGEIVTGLIYIDETRPDMHELANTPPEALATMPFDKLCPGKKTLASIQSRYR